MSTKIYSKLHGLARMIALVAILCLPFLSVSVEAQCAAPTGIRVATAAPEAVTLQWTVAAADEHHYDIRVATRQLTSAELGAGAAGTATAATEGVVFFKNDTVLATSVFQATGLTAGSQYYLHLRKNCAWDDAGYSSWVTYAFNTPCQATAALPIAEGFNADALPSCWSLGGNAPTVYSYTKHGSEGKSIKLTATASEGSFLYSPVLATSANAYYLTGFAYGAKDAVLKLGFALTEDLQTVVEIGEVKIAAASTWQAFDALIPAMYQAACASAEYVWVIYTAAGNTTTVYVDDVTLATVPPCLAPVALTVGNVTDATAVLSWTERGTATAWNVQLVQGTDTTIVPASANPFTLSNLSANTSYKVRVQAACGSEDSDWTAWASFKTVCPAMTLPYSEDFNTYTSSATSSSRPSEDVVYPDCWMVLNETGSSSSYPQAFLTTYSGYNVSGKSFFVKMSSTTPLVAVLPSLAVEPNAALVVNFRYRTEGTGPSNGHVQLGYMTNPSDASSFVQLKEYAQINMMTEVEEMVTLPANVQLAFRFAGGSSNNYYASIDNLVVKYAPTCLKPTGLAIAATTAENVKLAWTAGGSETSWELTYKLGTGDKQTVTVNGTPEYTIAGLEASTSYSLSQLSLRAICSETDSSDVATFSNITFKTPCAIETLPIEEDFANGIGDCWTRYSGPLFTDSVSTASATTTTSGWNKTSKVFNNEVKVNIYGTSCKYWLVSPSFTVTDATTQLAFDYALTDYGNTNVIKNLGTQADDKFIVAISTDGSTWYRADATVWSNDGQGDFVYDNVPNTGAHFSKSLAQYVGQTLRVAFYGESTASGGDNDFHVANFTVYVPASCERPQGITASAVSANKISVEIADADSAHTAWEVVVGRVGFNPADSTGVAVSAKKATVTIPFNMVGQQNYEAYVRAVCSATDKSEWRGPSSFKYTDWSVFANGISFTSPGAYPWQLIQDAGEYVAASGNVHIVNSVSDLVATVDVPENTKTTVSFSWETDSYYYYEGFVIYVDEETPTNTNYDEGFGKNSGETYEETYASGDYQVVFTTPGEHTIRFRHMYTGSYTTSNGEGVSRILAISRRDVSCVEPSVFTMGAITDNSAVLNWNNTGADNWEVLLYAKPQAAIVVDSALNHQTVAQPTATFNGLAQNTLYYAYIRSYCGASPSEWSQAVKFRTECSARELPYNEGFETSGAELCWKVIGNAVTMNATSAAPFDGTKSLEVYNDSVVGMLVSPRLDAASLAAYEVSLAVKLSNVRYHAAALKPLTIGVMTDPSNAGTYVDLGDIVIPSANSWKEYRFSLADLATPDYADWANAQYVVVSMSDSATYYFDAIKVALPASCAKPTAFDVQSVGEEVVFDWVSEATAHYAEIALGDSVVFAGSVTKPFTPAGLEANTSYKARVRAICDADYSEWTPWINFTTPCALAALPFSETFESYTSAPVNAYSVPAASRIAPDCWKVIAEGTSVGSIMNSGSSYTSYASSGARSMMFYGKETVHVVLPTLNANNKALRFRMTYRTEGTSASNGELAVGYLTNSSSTASFVGLDTLPRVSSLTSIEVIFPAMQYVTPCVLYIGGTADNWYAAFDDVMVDEAPTCIKPTHLELDSVSTNFAKLTWSAGGSETSWELIYKLSSKDAADTVIVTGTPEYTISDLAPATNYTLRNISLRAICSESDSSEVVSVASLAFTTECAILSLPFSENFDALTSGIPACWDNEEGTTTTGSYKWSFFATGATGSCVRFNSFSNPNGKTNTLKTPAINVGNATTVNLSFMYKNPTGGEYDVLLSRNGGATFTDTLATGLSAVAWTKFTTSLAVAANEELVLAFYGVSNYGNGDAYLYLDDVEIEEPAACDRPAAITLTDVEGTSVVALINDANGSAWEYVLNDVTATPIAIATDSFLISGLTPQTEYTIYVRRVCSATDKSAWRSVIFKTACAAVDYVSEDFEDCESGTSGDIVPECWTLMGSTSTMYPYVYNSATSAASGTQSLYAYASYSSPLTAAIALPEISGDLNQYRLKLKAKATTANASPIFVIISNTNDWATMTDDEANYIIYNNGNPILPTTTYQEYTVSFNNYEGNGHYVVLYYYELEASLYVDDVVLELLPSCLEPAALNLVSANSTSMTIAIDDEEGVWEYALDSVTATPVALANDTFTIANLESATQYTVYVRRVCSATDKSAWIRGEFRTTCDYRTLPFSENFNTLTAGIPSCWDNEEGTTTSDAYKWNYFATGYTGAGLRFDSYMNQTGNTNILKTPVFAVATTGSVDLSFQFKNVTGGAMQLLVSHDGGQTFTQLDQFAAMSVAVWTEESYTIPVTAGDNLVVAFKAISNYGSGDAYLYLDDITLAMSASCQKPQGLSVLSVSATQVDLQIADTVSSHNAWQVVVGAEGFNPDQATPYDAIATLTSINPATPFVSGQKYEAYVRVVCGEGEESAWRGPVSFKFVDYASVTTIPMEGVGAYPWTVNGDRLESTNEGNRTSASDLVATVVVPAGEQASLSFNWWANGSTDYGYLVMFVDTVPATNTSSYYDSSFGKKYGTSSSSVYSPKTGTYTLNLSEGTHTIRWRYYISSVTSYSTFTGGNKAQIWNLALTHNAFFMPLNVKADNITSSSATITWNEGHETTSSEVRLLSNESDTTYFNAVSPLNVTGLEPSTQYSVRVRCWNAAGDSTAWTTAYRFKTGCGEYPLPFVEDFELDSGAVASASADCWILPSGVTMATNSTYAASGTRALKFATSSDVCAVLPNFGDLNGKRMSLAWRCEGTGSTTTMGYIKIGYITNALDASSFVALKDCNQHAFSYSTVTVNYTTVPVGARPAILYYGATSSAWYLFVDDIVIEEIPNCEKPESVNATDLTPTQVVVAIVDGEATHTAWQVAFGPHGFNPDSIGAQVVDATSKLVSFVPTQALQDGLYYDLYARTVCGEGEVSAWTDVKAYKYVDVSAVSNVNLNLNEGLYPWTIIDDGGVAKLQSTNQHVQSSTSDFTATVVVAEGERAYITFDYFSSCEITTGTIYDYLCLYIDESTPSTTNFYTGWGTAGQVGSPTGVTGTCRISLSEGAHTIRWRYRKDGSSDVEPDLAQVWNINFVSTTEWAPDSILLEAVSADSALISWTACPNAISHEVKIGNDTIATNVNSIALHDLTANTVYDIQIRSLTATGATLWSDFRFITGCAVTSLPIAESFEDGMWRNCWTNEHVSGSATGLWKSSTLYTADGDSSIYVSSQASGNSVLLASPEFVQTAGETYRLSFSLYHYTSSSYPNEKMVVTVEGATSTTLTSLGYRAPNEVIKSGLNSYEYIWTAENTDTASVHFLANFQNGFGFYLDDVRIAQLAKADTINDAICEGYEYAENGFSIPVSELTPGYHTYSIVEEAADATQSDTLRTLVLFVSQATTIEVTDTVCYGGSYTKNGFNRSNITASRDLRYDGVNMYGCDSTFIAHIFVPEHEYASNVNICEGESYVFGDTTIYTAGRYVKTFQKSDCDCDSTVTLVLNVLAASSEYSYTICQGETYTFGTKTYNATGDYTATFKNVLGCDSVVTLHLTVQAPVVTTFNETFCEGTVFTADNVSPKFVALSAAGEYRDTIKTVSGCDSILVLNLTETKTVKVTLNEEVCKNDLYVFAGNTFNVVNDTTITFNTVSEVTGCDSIVTLNIKAKDCGDALENVRAYELEINPNPVNVGEEAIIRTDIVFTAGYVLRVYDPAGRLVCESTDPNGRVPGLPVAGAYTVRISAADHNYQAKLIVK